MHTFIYLNFLNFRFIGNSEIQSFCWPSPQVHLRYEVSQQDMKEEQRVALVDAVTAAGRGARVVITHGTDTMLENLKQLNRENLKRAFESGEFSDSDDDPAFDPSSEVEDDEDEEFVHTQKRKKARTDRSFVDHAQSQSKTTVKNDRAGAVRNISV